MGGEEGDGRRLGVGGGEVLGGGGFPPCADMPVGGGIRIDGSIPNFLFTDSLEKSSVTFLPLLDIL